MNRSHQNTVLPMRCKTMTKCNYTEIIKCPILDVPQRKDEFFALLPYEFWVSKVTEEYSEDDVSTVVLTFEGWYYLEDFEQ